MHLNKMVQLTLTLPLMLLLTALSLAAYTYLNSIMTENANQKGLLVVQMVKTAMLSNVSAQGHSLNSGDMMEQFRTMPGLREIRLVRGDAVTAQFGPSHSDSAPEEAIEFDMLSSGKTSQVIEEIDGYQVLHFNGPLKALASDKQNCLQCHQVPAGTVLGGLSVQVDLSDEMSEARMVPLFAFGTVILCGLFIAYALRRFSAPIASTALQIASAMRHGEQGNFSHRLSGIRTDSNEVYQIIESTNGFLGALQQHIGGIVKEVELMTGPTHEGSQDNMIARARQAVDLMLYSTRLKNALENDHDLSAVFSRLTNVLKNDFNLDRFGIFESMDGTSRLQPIVMVGLPEEWNTWCDSSLDIDASACPATRTGTPVEVCKNPEACKNICGHYNPDPSLLHICIPINDAGGTRTLITILYEADQSAAMQPVIARLRYVIRAIDPELRTKRLLKVLKDITVHDPLTGIFNRRFLDEIQNSLVASVKRRHTSLGVLMCDIDLFKQVNDTYGHETGDMVLKGLAELFSLEMRDSDYVIRLGGEEILVLLMDTDKERSIEIAERLRDKVSQRTFRSSQGEFSKTVSIGVAIFDGSEGDLSDTMQQADAALYRAKHTGRNRVISYDDMPTEIDVTQSEAA